MDEALLFPSPNWFRTSVMAVSSDGWVVYGGPIKSLCILVPLPPDPLRTEESPQQPAYHAHVISKTHPEKIVSVDLCPEWPAKRAVLTGSFDGTVKQWNIDYEDSNIQVKPTQSHDVHIREKEEIAGVGYSTETYAITVGGYGQIVKWDITSNVTRIYKTFMKSFRPVCMSCSHHQPLNVAVGTKQGVVFVLDLNDTGKVLYKVRAHDDEVANLSWCPQYEVEVKKAIGTSASMRMEAIRSQPDPDGSVPDASVDCKVRKLSTSETSGNESEIVEEEDLFDMYKDHEANEFGHKKFEPDEIFVKIHEDTSGHADYLSECLKLKSDILKRKSEPEPSIEALVEAFDKTKVGENDKQGNTNDSHDKEEVDTQGSKVKDNTQIDRDAKPVNEKDIVNTASDITLKEGVTKSVHIQKHMLASIGKNGTVQIWSKAGKQVSSCHLAHGNNKQKHSKTSNSNCVTLLWHKANALLLTDSKCNVVLTNPLEINSKNKLTWSPVHGLHKRVAYCLASGAARMQPPPPASPSPSASPPCPVWSVGQDRTLVCYDTDAGRALSVYSTCGGYVYELANCPYDADKVAVGVGDGAVRVLGASLPATFWNNVQGKVLKLDWHHTKENLLAFGTGEARVGLIDTGGNIEKPAKLLTSVLSNSVYGLTWSEDALYACAEGTLVRYTHCVNTKISEMPGPETVEVSLEGSQWRVTEVTWSRRALCVGSQAGGVALCDPAPPHHIRAAAFPYTKLIHCLDWHPQQVSTASDESPYKNLIAVCSADTNITILEVLETDEGEMKLSSHSTLGNHKGVVFRVQWSPHHEGRLLSCSSDSTVKVWSVESGACTHVFPGNGQAILVARWESSALHPHHVLSGGADFCLRRWDLQHYPAHLYQDPGYQKKIRKTKKVCKIEECKKEVKPEAEAVSMPAEVKAQVAANAPDKTKVSKKFLYPIVQRQITENSLNACRKLLTLYLGRRDGVSKEAAEPDNAEGRAEEDYDCDFVKMFGSTNDVNQLLDMEQRAHQEEGGVEAWLMVELYRGRVAEALRYAVERDLLCPFLLSLAPQVSFKYWKDTTQLFISQIERICARGDSKTLYEPRRYGGGVYQSAALQLAVQDVVGAVRTLSDARLYKEAYLLCRARHAPSLASALLVQWAARLRADGVMAAAAAVCIAMEDLPQAATILGTVNKEEYLRLAAEIAKVAGQNTFADHIMQKTDRIKTEKEQSMDSTLADLPSKVELILKVTETTANECESINEDVASSHLQNEKDNCV